LYDIYTTGNPEEDYHELFIQRDYTDNPEIIYWKKYSDALQVYNVRHYVLQYPNGRAVTKQMVDAYLCDDGTPVSVKGIGHNTLEEEMEGRDARLKQSVFTKDALWKINVDGSVQYWDEVFNNLNMNSQHQAPTGYAIKKIYDPNVIYHSTNYETTPNILYRYAEVLLNYIEAKAELGTITQADVDKTIKKLRDRAGMPNLTIDQIVTDPAWDFPELSPLLNEIRRERRIELFAEGRRWPDILRWAAADELIVGKRPKGMKAAQIAEQPYPVDADGFVDPFQLVLPNGYQFKTDRDYLNPIPEQEITLNPKLTQNPGWR
jgi:hypothetical protein